MKRTQIKKRPIKKKEDIDWLKKIREVRTNIPGFDAVKFIHSNR